MSLLLAMLPIYLLANIHCAGMCGPLVMFISRHRFRHAYFLGRIFSFSLAGLLAGTLGSLINVTSKNLFLSVSLSFLISICMLSFACGQLLPSSLNKRLSHILLPIHQAVSKLMLKDKAWPIFLFGFLTVALPCGQSLMVFSSCALWGDPLIGLLNGGVFAILTSPSLWLAMKAKYIFKKNKRLAQNLIAMFAIFVAGISFCRGLAELEVIPHLVLNERLHITIY